MKITKNIYIYFKYFHKKIKNCFRNRFQIYSQSPCSSCTLQCDFFWHRDHVVNWKIKLKKKNINKYNQWLYKNRYDKNTPNIHFRHLESNWILIGQKEKKCEKNWAWAANSSRYTGRSELWIRRRTSNVKSHQGNVAWPWAPLFKKLLFFVSF